MNKLNLFRPKIAIVVSHPIQHFCPMYASWASHSEWQTKVFFASAIGAKPYLDKDFGKNISWGNLKLDHFNHVFLNSGHIIPVTKEIDAPELEMEITKYAPDVVVVYGYSQKIQKKAVKWAKKNQKKIFYISDTERAHPEPYWKWALKNLRYRSYFKHIHCCLTVGNHNEHYYSWMGVPLQRMVRLGFSIDTETYKKAYTRKQQLADRIRQQYQIPKNNIIVLVVGKLLSSKRQVELVKALFLLELSSQIGFTALIVGSGPDMSTIETLIGRLTSNRAIVTGFVHPEELVAYYAACDIYVHPSERDAHPLAVGEAIYMGCPVVVSDRCGVHGPADDVQIGHNGFVYPCGDVAALAHYLSRLGENADLRQRFGKFSHEFALESQSRAHDTGIRAALSAVGLLDLV